MVGPDGQGLVCIEQNHTTMDLKAFNKKFETNPGFRTQIMGQIAAEVKRSQPGEKVDLAQQLKNGHISELTLKPQGGDQLSQLSIANAAIDVLKRHGVTDLEDLKTPDSFGGLVSLNVIYKDGGWIINS